jgi:hypothetical protein
VWFKITPICFLLEIKIIFSYLEIKSTTNFPFFRRFKRTLLSYKTQEHPLDTNQSKALQRQNTNLNSAKFAAVSNITLSTALTTVDTDKERITVIQVA